MNSLKKGEGVSLLNFVGGPGTPLLNFEGGPGVPLLNFSGVLGPTFQLWGGSRGSASRGPGPTFTPCLRTTGFIKSIDHRPNNHRSNRQDSISKTWSMKNIHFHRTQTQLGRCRNILRSIVYLMNKSLYKRFIYLHKIFIFSFLQKKTTFLSKTYGGFNYVHIFAF